MRLVLDLALAGLAAALVLGFVRVVKGPTSHDRVVALDNVGSTVAGLVGLYAIRLEQPILLDVLIVVAFLSFISTVALAKYLERGAHP